ncbi:MAG: hypothetical protein VXW31_05680 [Planctomycetota bacterium]|nr:hypothetical protein [Planctomycetota bacterium]
MILRSSNPARSLAALTRGAWGAAATLAAAPAAAGQSGEPGTVFENTHLPFESLKAPPDSAFDIAMVSVGVFLLVWLSIAAFLVLAKLDSIQRLLEKRLSAADEAEGAASAAADRQRVALVALRVALEESSGRMDRSLVTLADRIGGSPEGAAAAQAEELRATLQEALATLSQHQRDQTRAIEAALSAAGVPGVAGGPESPARLIQRVRAHLAALGYEAIEIVTPSAELEAEQAFIGEIVVEARRGGTVHKGRATLDDGVIVDVELRPAHRLFP